MKDVPGEEMEDGFWSCNIDNRGRLVRLVFGVVFIALATGTWLAWNSAFWASGLLAFGLVGLFEAFRGWCVLRAFGLRTPF